MVKVLSDAEIIGLFGNPWAFVQPEGSTARWEREILDVIGLPRPLPLSWAPKSLVTTIRCHRRIAPNLRKALGTILNSSETAGLITDYAGCFNFRPQRKAMKLSRHAWAIAIDLNANDNPMGVTPTMDPRVVKAFEDEGFVWGGRFGRNSGARVDGMHFEFVDPSKLIA